MKRIALFLVLACAAAAYSCQKEENTSQKTVTPVNLPTYTLGFEVAESYSLSADSAPRSLPVKLVATPFQLNVPVPSNLSLADEATVTCEPEGIIDIELSAAYVQITPKAEGTATLTFAPKNVPATGNEYATCQVTVTAAPAKPVSVSIVKEGPGFSEGILYLLEGGSAQLGAVVMNDLGAVSGDFDIFWSASSGQYISLDSQTGRVDANRPLDGESRDVTVGVEVVGHPELTDQVTVRIQLAPTGVTLNFERISPNEDGELWMALGHSARFRIVPQPEGAFNDFTVAVSSTIVEAQTDGGYIKLVPSRRGQSSATVSVQSKSTSAKTSFKVYVYDYEEVDIKPGDYVYYRDGVFFTYDCGLRLANGASSVYADASRRRSTGPKDYSGEELWNGSRFVGVVAQTGLPEDNFSLNLLRHCRDGAKATGLYEYRDFDEDALRGSYTSSSQHALVLKKDETDAVEWQHNNERIAETEAQNSGTGIYQFQLYGRYAFSPEEKDYLNVRPGTFQCQYSPHGFLAHHLLRFYNETVNDQNYRVIPVDRIEAYTDAPKLSDGKGTTGWYLPGNWEWMRVKDNLPIINASLAQAGATQVTGYYWSPEEDESQYKAWRYLVENGSVKREQCYKDIRTHTNGSAKTRAVLYF